MGKWQYDEPLKLFARNPYFCYNDSRLFSVKLSPLMNPLEFPKLTSFVNDFSWILTSEKKEAYNTLFRNHESATGEQVVTVFFPHRQGKELLDIGLKLFNETGIGDKKLNNGLLLIVATEEKKLRIVVGKWLELKYTEMKCRDIIENHLRPLLNAGKYAEMVQMWCEIVNGEKGVKQSQNISNPPGFPKDGLFVLYGLTSIFPIVIIALSSLSSILFDTGFIFFMKLLSIFVVIFLVIYSLISIFFWVIRFFMTRFYWTSGVVWVTKISSFLKKFVTALSIALFLVLNFLQNLVFSPHCEPYSTADKKYEDCSTIILWKQFDQTFFLGYTQEYKDAHPEEFQYSSSNDWGGSSHDSDWGSSSSDSDWGGGSSNGGGWGD